MNNRNKSNLRIGNIASLSKATFTLLGVTAILVLWAVPVLATGASVDHVTITYVLNATTYSNQTIANGGTVNIDAGSTYSFSVWRTTATSPYTFTATSPSGIPESHSSSGSYYVFSSKTETGQWKATVDNSSAYTWYVQTAASLPDLVVNSVTVSPSSQVPGGSISVTFTVRNQGGQSTSSAATYLYLSTDSTINSSDTYLCSDLYSYAPGESRTMTKNCTIPGTVAPGTYYVGVYADALSSVPESNENNNTRTYYPFTVSQPPLPDLVVQNVSVTPTTVTPGSGITVSFTIVNQGTQAASIFSNDVRLSPDTTITGGDQLLANCNIGSLAAGASYTCSNIPGTIPSTTGNGTYYVGVIADTANTVSESNEGNNTGSTTITIGTQPDLVVDSVTVSPSSQVPGGSISVTFTVRNQGGQSTSSAATYLYLSTDSTINSSDTYLCSDLYSYAPGESRTMTKNCTIPGTVAPGTYYVGVYADALSSVPESNENNNTRTYYPFTVSQPPLPDLVVQNVSVTPTTVTPGSGITVSFTIVNQGTQAASIFSNDVRLSPDTTITGGDQLLANCNIGSSGSGGIVHVQQYTRHHTVNDGQRHILRGCNSRYGQYGIRIQRREQHGIDHDHHRHSAGSGSEQCDGESEFAGAGGFDQRDVYGSESGGPIYIECGHVPLSIDGQHDQQL